MKNDMHEMNEDIDFKIKKMTELILEKISQTSEKPTNIESK